MSWDLLLATRNRPRPDDLVHLIPAERPVHVVFDDTDSSGSASESPEVRVGVPVPMVDLDGIDPLLASAVPEAKWLTEVTVPAGASVDARRTAIEVAIRISKRYRGAVLNPQTGRIEGATRQPQASSRSQAQRIAVLTLEWLSLRPFNCGRLVPRLQASLPEAVPTKFGSSEPLTQVFGQTDTFCEWWDGLADTWGYGYWRGNAPFLLGSVNVARRTPRSLPPIPVNSLSMQLDARSTADEHDADRVASAFIEIAQESESFYGAGYVRRGVIMRGTRVAYDAGSDRYAVGSKWWGLPGFATWIAWFGRPYTDLLGEPVLRTGRSYEGGFVLRPSREPRDPSELKEVFPPIPKDLIRSGDQLVRSGDMRTGEFRPARQIPFE